MNRRFLIGAALAVLSGYSAINGFGGAGIVSSSRAAGLEYAAQVSNERGIKVTVTPQRIAEKTETWEFQVALETHTQDLTDDIAASSVLTADGKSYAPLGWEGSPPGGHHRKGLLRFKAIASRPPSLELQIRLKGDASPRVFRWALK